MELWRKSLFFNFAVDYHQKHPIHSKEIEITESMFNDFVSFVQSKNFVYKIEGENEVLAFLKTAREESLPKDIIDSGEDLLKHLNELKANDLLNQKNEIRNILLSELAEKYYGNREKIRYSLKNDEQLHAAMDVVLNKSEYKKILAIK
jgi:carboxyl-terminal processing protease